MNPDSMDPGLVTPAGAQPISVRTVRAAMVAVGHDPADWALPPTGRPAIPDRLVSRVLGELGWRPDGVRGGAKARACIQAIRDEVIASRDQEYRLAEQLVDVLDRAIAAWSGEQTAGCARSS
jgi:hypothetical protein